MNKVFASCHLKGDLHLDINPLNVQCVIDDLVELWQTYYVPRDLNRHINRLGTVEITNYFRQVCEDLSTEEDNEKTAFYASFSASEFKQFLQDEYCRLNQIHIERVEQAKARWRKEVERKAKADFETLGEQMAKATTRAELVELGQKRVNLAPLAGVSESYINHCWHCKSGISSDIHAQCPDCKFYICSSCGSCLCGFLNY